MAAKDKTVEFINYVPHSKAIDYMINSSLLLLLIPESDGNKLIITGKLFEYIASRKPILCIGPKDGEAARIISKLNNGVCFDYSESENIGNYINSVIDNPTLPECDVSDFTRRNLTKKLARTFNDVSQ